VSQYKGPRDIYLGVPRISARFRPTYESRLGWRQPVSVRPA